MSTNELKSLHAKSELRLGAGVDSHSVVHNAPGTFCSYNKFYNYTWGTMS